MAKRWVLVAGWVVGCGVAVGQAASTEAGLPVERRVDELVGRMTLAEKVSQMQNGSVAIPRLGVPAYDWWSEGLHGIARSGYATVFPQAIGLAATWDTELEHRVAGVIGLEARAKYNEAIRHDNHAIYFGLTVWSPNINIFRDPRWGRGQETYGEDPFLTGRMGVAFVTGLQGEDPARPMVVATPKHFAVHSGPEQMRHKFNVTPGAHDLEDTYLPAFRAAVTEGHADSLMCAYNAIDGSPACGNQMLLKDTLRTAWGFRGFVTSDCGAVYDFFSKDGHHFAPDAEHASALAVKAGTDTTCGDEYPALVQAVADGLITEAEIDTAVKRLFRARFELGMFDANDARGRVPFAEVDSEAHRKLAGEAARKSIVLLKNEGGFLPLKGKRTVAVVGPNAASLSALRGNYYGQLSAPVLPVDGLRREKGLTVVYAQGAPYAEGLALPAPRTLFRPGVGAKEQGLKAEYFNGAGFDGKAAVTRTDAEIDFDWNAATPAPGVDAKEFAVRWSGTIQAPAAGTYPFGLELSHCDRCEDAETIRVYVDGAQVGGYAVAPGQRRRSSSDAFSIALADTKPHAFRVEYLHKAPLYGAGLTLNWTPPAAALLPEAVAAARGADVVVAFVGLTADLEGEEMPIRTAGFSGGDRTDLKLPAAQEQMLEAVAATGKPVVVVLMSGSALAATWAEAHAKAVLAAWYPGEEGGAAIAETLLGRNNPAGRLPVTFYASVEQLPAFEDYGMKGRTYRYFTGKPLYGFGYGLSYTTFRYSGLTVAKTVEAGAPVTVSVEVENAGARDGDEVAELYVTPPGEGAPVRALAGFERVHLRAGEKRRVTFAVTARGMSGVDASGVRAVRAGAYGVAVGGGGQMGGVAGGFVVRGEKVLER